jgi:hypothetical protein
MHHSAKRLLVFAPDNDSWAFVYRLDNAWLDDEFGSAEDRDELSMDLAIGFIAGAI